MSESTELTGPLVKMIRQMGIFCERMNTGRVKSRAGGWMQLHTAGTADIVAFPPRRVVWLETKTAKGRTNKEQIESQSEFAERVTRLGHEYYRIESIDEALTALKGVRA